MRGKTLRGWLLPHSPVPGGGPARPLSGPFVLPPRRSPVPGRSLPLEAPRPRGGAARPSSSPRRQRDTQPFCPRRLRKAAGKVSSPSSPLSWPCDAQPGRQSLLRTGFISLFLETLLEISRLRQRFLCLLLRRLGRGTLLSMLPGASEAARGTLPAPSATASPLLIPVVVRISGVCLLQVSSPSTREKDYLCSCPKYHSEGSVSLLSPSRMRVPQSPLHTPAKQQIRLHPCLV